MKKFQFSDDVSLRIVQIFQEAILLGVDGAGLLKEVRLVEDSENSGVLLLDDDYIKKVKERHVQLVSEATTQLPIAGTLTDDNE